MTLTDRLNKLRANRAKTQARIRQKSGRHQSVSFDQAKLVRETLQQLKLEMKIDKESA